MSAQDDLAKEERTCPKIKSIKKYSRKKKNHSTSNQAEDMVLRRAISEGLAHPKLQNTSKRCVSQKRQILPKGQLLKLILARLRSRPGTQLGYLNRLEKIRSEGEQAIKQQKPYELCCSICIDLLLDPMVLPCGHGFCRKCLEFSLNYKKQCPLCRDPLREGQPVTSLSLQHIVNNHLNKMTDHSLKTIYEDRLRDAQASRKKVKPEALLAGTKVDVMTQRNIWHNALIMRTLMYDGQQHIVVSYRDVSRQYEQMIQVTSQRLAPSNTHTTSNIEEALINLMSPDQSASVYFQFETVFNDGDLPSFPDSEPDELSSESG